MELENKNEFLKRTLQSEDELALTMHVPKVAQLTVEEVFEPAPHKKHGGGRPPLEWTHKYFEKTQDDHAKCKLCPIEHRPIKWDGHTMAIHLNTQHHLSKDNAQIVEAPADFQDQATNLFVAFLLAEGLPLSLASSAFLIAFLEFICPAFKLPSPNTITNTILPIQQKKAQEWINDQMAESLWVTIASDGW